MLAKVETLEKTIGNPDDNGGEAYTEDASFGTPGLSRSTRDGRGTKRKQEVEELCRQATDIHKMAKMMKEEGRPS